MKLINILKKTITIIWCMFCLVGILGNCKHYDFYDWIVSLLIAFIPFVLCGAFKKRKKSNSDNTTHTIKKHEINLREINTTIQKPTTPKDLISLNTEELFSKIPNEVLRLLWIKDINITANEPSMIDVSLMISDIITESDYVTGYYPNYQTLSPAQRYIYLKWLEDIRKPIDIGYVFLFYYGLERHLFLGDFENAYKMIETLRQYHNNNSFQNYSSDALLISGTIHGRYDLIQNMPFDTLDTPIKFFLKHKFDLPITSDDIIEACRKFGFTNTRYIKENRKLFKELLDKKLYDMYGQYAIKFSDDDFKNVTENCPLVLANYLLTQNRVAPMPDITTNNHVASRIFSILSSVHEEYKALKRLNKKTTN